MASFADLFAQLTASQRALLPFFRSAAATDQTPTQILASLRASGAGIRTQTGLDIISVLRENVLASRELRLTPNDVILSPEFFGQGSPGQNRNFLFTVLARGTSETGEIMNKYITISSNDSLTKNQILDKARNFAYGKGGSGNYQQLTELTVTEALASPALGG